MVAILVIRYVITSKSARELPISKANLRLLKKGLDGALIGARGVLYHLPPQAPFYGHPRASGGVFKGSIG